jgi:hypothetical protein
MHKLVILIEQVAERTAFDEAWPEFLHQAEQMPGLLREATSQVEAMLYGERGYMLMHELFFATRQAAEQAMASAPGREAGRLLQAMTGGRLALFFADHKEDELENIRKHSAVGE